MLDSEVVAGDEEVDGIEVVLGALGEGQGLADQAADPLAQRTKPTLDVAGFTVRLAAAAVGSRRERSGIGVPVVATGGTPPVASGQRSPQVCRALLAPVAERPGDDLAGAPTQRHPQPKLLCLGTDKAPEFVEFKHVAVLAGQQRIHKGGQALSFFPPTKP